MRAREFIVEQHSSIQDDVAGALPATYVIPKLQNQDPYLQYRFGVAIAGSKGAKQRSADNVPNYEKESTWGENQVVVSFDPSVDEFIDDALNAVGLTPTDKKMISTPTSDEGKTVGNISPLKAFKGYRRK